MICFMCKGKPVDKKTTFMVEVERCIIIVKGVPSQVCLQCGDTTYSHAVAKSLEATVDSLQSAITEIAVVNFSTEAA